MKSWSQWGVFDGLFQLVHIGAQARNIQYNDTQKQQEHIWNQEEENFQRPYFVFFTPSLDNSR